MLPLKLEPKGGILDEAREALVLCIVMIFGKGTHSSLTAEESARLKGLNQEFPYLLL